MSTFLYLFQVKSELPVELEQAASPRGEIRFLTYGSPSSDPRSIHLPHSSWTQGRNRLLREVLGTPHTYLIFGDADVQFELTALGRRRSSRGAHPWRAFEDFLLTYNPAVGCASYARQLQGLPDNGEDAQTLRFFDPVLNAFHRDAVVPLLPYYDGMDEESEFYSGSIVCSLAADLYPGAVLQTNRVRVINQENVRSHGELLMSKPETLYLDSLRDPATAVTYRRQTMWGQARHPAMGPPAPAHAPAAYLRNRDELARRYHMDHPIWVRKEELLTQSPEADVYTDSPESERARRWRAHREKLPDRKLTRVAGAWMSTQTFRRKFGLVRSNPVIQKLRGIPEEVRCLVARHRVEPELRILQSMWRDWVGDPDRVLAIGGEPRDRLLLLVGDLINRVPEGALHLLEVDTAGGHTLGQLCDPAVLRRPLISIGVDERQTGPVSWYTGYVIGDPLEERFHLATILDQYGVAPDACLHHVRIGREGPSAAMEVFRTLGERMARTLFLTFRYTDSETSAGLHGSLSTGPLEGNNLEELRGLGFRLLSQVSPMSGRPGQATFVQHSLLKPIVH